MTYSYWIQNSDFSNPPALKPKEPVRSPDSLLAVFDSYNWRAQKAYENQALASGKECCEAAIGINRAADATIQIRPDHFHRDANIVLTVKERQRVMGVIPLTREHIIEASNVPLEQCRKLIRWFLSGEDAAVAQTLLAYPYRTLH